MMDPQMVWRQSPPLPRRVCHDRLTALGDCTRWCNVEAHTDLIIVSSIYGLLLAAYRSTWAAVGIYHRELNPIYVCRP